MQDMLVSLYTQFNMFLLINGVKNEKYKEYSDCCFIIDCSIANIFCS